MEKLSNHKNTQITKAVEPVLDNEWHVVKQKKCDAIKIINSLLKWIWP